MAKYRGFVGQVAPLSGLGITTRRELNGERYAYRVPYTAPTTTTAQPLTTSTGEPIRASDIYTSQPIKQYPGETGPIYVPPVSPAEQELEYRQYSDGKEPETVLERQAKIDEAIQRLKESYAATVMPNGQTIPIGTEKPKPNLLPLVIGAGLIWLMS